MVVIERVGGKDNGVIVFTENPATMQEFIKRIEKEVIYQNNVIEFN